MMTAIKEGAIKTTIKILCLLIPEVRFSSQNLEFYCDATPSRRDTAACMHSGSTGPSQLRNAF